ncbi:hypothetical protein IGI04_010614 [Brassica rapa subsp. trilocularis]|uniref:Uncharacterized protein n=1 Tax=Brassica rapa subsp. trilocularis TaxID=1813537 RepID=A0ABQ7N0S3_BRACM|nr:hypothetical protein IGI04_010614 [Brassica rapa subsp. trilocularis]
MQSTPLGNGDDGAIPISFDQAKPLWLLSPTVSVSQTPSSKSVVSPEIVVREDRVEDWWEVAETHCTSFFPGHSFPLDLVLRVDRLMAMIMGFSVPPGCLPEGYV